MFWTVTDQQPVNIRTDLPHGARIWNYWLGGKDNYAADRAVGEAVRAAFPAIVDGAVESRQFLIRAVRFLAAEAGVRQFLDVGTGLPTMQNTHEVAQAVAPESRIVYVDNDPLVLTHARALLVNTSPEGTTTYLDADYRDPELIIARAREVLDLDEPVAVLCMGIFGYLVDPDEAGSIITRLMSQMPTGSYLALWDGTDTSDAIRAGVAAQAEMGSPYHLRTVEEMRRWFAGLELLEPGLVPVTQWRPSEPDPDPIDGYGAVARKP